MTKAALYVRLSKEDEDKRLNDDSQSIKNQKMMLLDYCQQNNLEVYQIYSDDDYKGSDRHRPAFNSLLQDAKKGLFEIVLCKSQSRFTREIEIIEKYLHGLFPLWGIRFISIVDNVDTFNQGNKKARQINGLINEWYLEDMSNNIRQTFKTKCQNGHHIGSFACYGYLKDSQNKGHLIIDPIAAKVVQMIFKLYLDGFGQLKIAQYLNQQQILNPTAYKRSIGLKYQNHQINSKNWSPSSVRLILKNEMYIGNMVQHRKESISYKNKKQRNLLPTDWIIKENTHEAIIDRGTWNQVQQLLEKRTRANRRGIINKYAGKLKCLNCKEKLVSNSWNHIRYFRCRSKLYNKDACKGALIKEVDLDSLIVVEIEKLKSLIDTKEIKRKLQINDFISNKIIELENEIEVINDKKDQREKMIETMYYDKLQGVISNKEYTKYRDDCLKELEFMDIKKKELSVQIEKINNLINEIKIEDYIDELKLSRKIINKMIEKIEVGIKDDQILVKVFWKF